MNARNILAVVLLLFVATTLVVIAGRKQPTNAPPEQSATNNTAATQVPEDGLIAYYFHGDFRCPTCRKIEAYAHDAIQEGFADELKAGEITWQVLNYEAPANAQFVEEFEIASPTVVLVQKKTGKTVASRNLTRVWELVGDQEKFSQYIQEQVEEMLAMNK